MLPLLLLYACYVINSTVPLPPFLSHSLHFLLHAQCCNTRPCAMLKLIFPPPVTRTKASRSVADPLHAANAVVNEAQTRGWQCCTCMDTKDDITEDVHPGWYSETSRRVHDSASLLQKKALRTKESTLTSLWRLTANSAANTYHRSRKRAKLPPTWSVRQLRAWRVGGWRFQKQLRWEALRTRFLAEHTVTKAYTLVCSMLSSTEALLAREKLHRAPEAAGEVNAWWATLVKLPHTDTISRVTFFWLYKKIISTLVPHVSKEEISLLTAADWECDTADTPNAVVMQFHQFKRSLLGIAMVWVETGTESECVHFFCALRLCMHVEKPTLVACREADITESSLASIAEAYRAMLTEHSAALGAGLSPMPGPAFGKRSQHTVAVACVLLASTCPDGFAQLDPEVLFKSADSDAEDDFDCSSPQAAAQSQPASPRGALVACANTRPSRTRGSTGPTSSRTGVLRRGAAPKTVPSFPRERHRLRAQWRPLPAEAPPQQDLSSTCRTARSRLLLAPLSDANQPLLSQAAKTKLFRRSLRSGEPMLFFRQKDETLGPRRAASLRAAG